MTALEADEPEAPPDHLAVPDIDEDADALAAALAYAAAGWYVVPVKRGAKNPGSIVGDRWQTQSTRDPQQIVAWYAGTDHGIALHAGRSGAVIFDVDDPDQIPEPLGQALGTTPPPMQTTRATDDVRGHYLYAQPPGRSIGNSTGQLGKAWGEVRGRNGVIIVTPSVHQNADRGGRYTWRQTGPVPPLPDHLAQALPEASATVEDTITDAEVHAFLEDHTGNARPALLKAVTRKLEADIEAGGSRHDSTVVAACWAMREARAGLYPAEDAADQLGRIFTTALNGERRSEFPGILAWAIAQAQAADDLEELRQAVNQRAPHRDPLAGLIAPQDTDANTTTRPTDEASNSEVPGEQHRGQARMAYRLANAYTGHLMHVHGLGWFAWSGRHWTEDNHGQAKRAVLDVLRCALAESLGDQELRKDVRRCESDAGLNGVLGIAAALEPFAFTVNDLDADPYLLNCANGTLDLRTLQLRPHDPADCITKVTRGAYNPDATGTAWPAFLQRVMPDTEVCAFLQRLAGVGLLGLVVEHVLAILTGTGANGKGTFYKALGWALGDYAATAEPDLFMHREGAHPTGEMDLLGIRWIVVSENDRDRRLAEATMKRLTGGDTIKARRMRQNFVQFEPSHTPILVTNHLPKVSGDDPAIWRRLRVVPFEVVIPEPERDSHLDEALQLDADAVLAWAVAGYQQYAQRGLAEPDAVRVATDAYHASSDAVRRFLEECCLINPHTYATTGELFERWSRWAADDGTDPGSRKAFGQVLDKRGFPTGKPSNGRRLRHGIGLLADTDGDDE